MLRAIAGLLGGLLIGLLALAGVAFVGGVLFPIAVDPHIANPVEQAQAALPNAPLAALLFIALSWFVSALLGGLVAKLISGSSRICWTMVAILTLFCVINIFFAPFPMWMQIASFAAPLIGGLIANHLVKDRPAVADVDGDPGEMEAADIPAQD